jgi:hypothetical protein
VHAGVVSAVNLQAASDGGLAVGPLFLPRDYDASRPSFLSLQLIAIVAGNPPVGDVLFSVRVAYALTEGLWTNLSFTFLWTVPATFLINTTALVLMDRGSGNTFDPGTVPVGSCLSIWVQRSGSNALDTYPLFLSLVPSMAFRYFRRCQAVCCC